MNLTAALAVYEAADQSLPSGVALESSFSSAGAEKTYAVRIRETKSLDHNELRSLMLIADQHDVCFSIKHGYGCLM